ncbi:MAG: hypothetical protein LBQ38_07960 [Spirochaetaceae bacterium]|jgi:hypothetical protein|nr:hypothetical protein [Spirochaetaceae bacterium]
MPEQDVHTKALTFEDVWVMFQETDRKFQETDRKFQETDKKMQETDRQLKETGRQLQETDRMIKEMSREAKEAWAEASRAAGKLSNKLGIVVEHLVLTNILEKFNALGYGFTKATMNVLIEDKKRKIFTEVDAMLENGEYVLAIEVKTHLQVKDVNEHLKRMDKLRRQADGRRYPPSQKFLGAVAGAIAADNVKEYALRKGLYVIKQSGDTVTIENPAGFKPREW